VTLVSRMAALCVIALSAQGCAPKSADDNAAAPAATPVIAPSGVTVGATLREEITVDDGIRTRKVYEIRDGIKEKTLVESTKDGKLHGTQYRYANARLTEEVHYEHGKKVKTENQAWIDEMNELRSENCVLEKIPDHPDPDAKDPPMSQAMIDQWTARCNERPFSNDD
jgi:hypothetical protein